VQYLLGVLQQKDIMRSVLQLPSSVPNWNI